MVSSRNSKTKKKKQTGLICTKCGKKYRSKYAGKKPICPSCRGYSTKQQTKKCSKT